MATTEHSPQENMRPGRKLPAEYAGRGSPGSDAAGAASLGTTAKFQATSSRKGFGASAVSTVDKETGEIVTLKPSGRPLRDAVECRMERYALQAVARLLLPSHRVAKCMRYVQKNKDGVEVWKSIEHGRASYAGLQTCSSVAVCPICSAKISERRRLELMQLVAAHEAVNGVGSVIMVTRTIRHDRQDALQALVEGMTKARASYKGHRTYKALMLAAGLVGTVNALEVTHGHANGWHPHEHELLFLDHAPTADERQALEEALFPIWADAAERCGLSRPSRERGLVVSEEQSQVAAYVSKWGLESELTQWHRKNGRVDSRSPFDLLRSAQQSRGDDPQYRDGKLFQEYAAVFHGRHLLQFSRGLKAMYQVQECSDEELANRKDDAAVLLGKLSLDDWRLVCTCGQRGTLLEAANLGGWDQVEYLLFQLRNHQHVFKQIPRASLFG